MSVGGRIIEIKPMRITAGEYPGTKQDVNRYWCMDRHGDEVCVYAERQTYEPKLGDEIWWQEKTIYFDGNHQKLVKVGFSFRPAPEGE